MEASQKVHVIVRLGSIGNRDGWSCAVLYGEVKRRGTNQPTCSKVSLTLGWSNSSAPILPNKLRGTILDTLHIFEIQRGALGLGHGDSAY